MIFLRSIPFLFYEALLNVRRHGLMTLAVISTVAVALTILGVFGLIGWQIHWITDRLPRQFEVHAFLRSDLTRDDAERIRAQAQALPGVRSVALVSRDELWTDL